MKDRIIQLMTNESISASRLADQIQIQRSAISHILSGRNNPSLDFIQKILKVFPHISSDWLVLGKGAYKTSNESPQTSPTLSSNIQDNFLFNSNKNLSSNYIKPKDVPKPIKEKIIEKANPKVNKSVERVIVFYSDKTFVEYSPEEYVLQM